MSKKKDFKYIFGVINQTEKAKQEDLLHMIEKKIIAKKKFANEPLTN